MSAHPDLIFRLSRDGVVLDYHAGDLTELLVATELVGSSAWQVLPPDLAELTMRKIAATLESGREQAYDYDVDLPAGPQIFEARMVASGPHEVVAIVRNVTAARQAAERQRRFVEHTLLAQEEERRRIAQELQDEIGQVLTSISVRLAALEDAKTVELRRNHARDLRDLAVSATHDVSRLASELHPQVLDDLGFRAAVERLVAECHQRNGRSYGLQFLGNGYGALPPTHAIAAYRILQEAFTNVAKHAQARDVSVVIHLENQLLRMIVEDDGIGFEPGRVEDSAARGLGLFAIRERASLLAGCVEIESAPGNGTRVAVRLPIPH